MAPGYTAFDNDKQMHKLSLTEFTKYKRIYRGQIKVSSRVMSPPTLFSSTATSPRYVFRFFSPHARSMHDVA